MDYNQNAIEDIRLEQADKIVSACMSSRLTENVDVAITGNDMTAIYNGSILYNTTLKDIPPNMEPLGYTYSMIGRFPNMMLSRKAAIDINVYNKVMNYWNYYTEVINRSIIVAQEEDLLSNEEFVKICSIKSSEPMRMFRLPNNIRPGIDLLIPLIPGLLCTSLNKSDTIGIKVYDIDTQFMMVIFKIYRKKINRDVYMYYKILKLN